jgi:hypothetical protein
VDITDISLRCTLELQERELLNRLSSGDREASESSAVDLTLRNCGRVMVVVRGSV